MKVLIYTAMWERHQISEIFAIGIKRFMKSAPLGIECEVLAVCSSKEAVNLCKKHKFKYIEADNKPLGKKWNKGALYAINNIDFDYMLIMGDDDLIADYTWSYYSPYMRHGYNYFGFNSIYFYNTQNGDCVNYEYKNVANNKLIGCGRMISKRALIKAGMYSRVKFSINHWLYKKEQIADIPTYQAKYFVGMGHATLIKNIGFHLWNNTQNTGLDNESECNLLLCGFEPLAITTSKPLMVDLKSDFNIWSFDKIKKDATKCTFDEVYFLSKKELNLINKL